MAGSAVESTCLTEISITNTGDSPAQVCVYEYGQIGSVPWTELKNHCYTLNPHQGQWNTPTIVTDWKSSRVIKITTDSKFVVPQARYFDTSVSQTMPVYNYLPGDFQKVEIYS